MEEAQLVLHNKAAQLVLHKALAASDGISVGIRPQIVIAASRDLDERKNQNITELLWDTNQQT